MGYLLLLLLFQPRLETKLRVICISAEELVFPLCIHGLHNLLKLLIQLPRLPLHLVELGELAITSLKWLQTASLSRQLLLIPGIPHLVSEALQLSVVVAGASG